EAEADGDDQVGAPGEGLLPRASHREPIVFGDRALRCPAGVDGDLELLCEGAQLRRRVGPEDAVAGDDERALRTPHGLDDAVDGCRVAGAAECVRRIDAGASALPADVVL